MSIDDFQRGEEAVAQLAAERAEQERGRLAAELAAEPAFDTAEKDRVRRVVRVDRIAANRNIRPDLPEIHDLALSIRQRGLLTPPLVRRRPGSDEEYLIVAGHRRHAALVALGWEQTPVDEIVDLDEDEAFEIQLLENVQRVQLEPMQAARGLRLLMKRRDGATAAQVARSIGLSPSWVRRHLKLLELPDEVQQRVSDGDLSLTIADLLRRQTDKGTITSRQAVDLAGRVAQGDMTPAEIRATFGETPGQAEVAGRAVAVGHRGDGAVGLGNGEDRLAAVVRDLALADLDTASGNDRSSVVDVLPCRGMGGESDVALADRRLRGLIRGRAGRSDCRHRHGCGNRAHCEGVLLHLSSMAGRSNPHSFDARATAGASTHGKAIRSCGQRTRTFPNHTGHRISPWAYCSRPARSVLTELIRNPCPTYGSHQATGNRSARAMVTGRTRSAGKASPRLMRLASGPGCRSG